MFWDGNGNENPNQFRCKGRFAGSYDRRSTPGGIILEDIIVAVPTRVPWKEKKVMHLRITCWGECRESILNIKTGDNVVVEGFIEEVNSNNKKKNRLVAMKLEKENKNE